MRDRAVGAVPRADVAEDHERGGAVLPALADVRAVRFLADGMEVELAHQLLEPEVIADRRAPCTLSQDGLRSGRGSARWRPMIWYRDSAIACQIYPNTARAEIESDHGATVRRK